MKTKFLSTVILFCVATGHAHGQALNSDEVKKICTDVSANTENVHSKYLAVQDENVTIPRSFESKKNLRELYFYCDPKPAEGQYVNVPDFSGKGKDLPGCVIVQKHLNAVIRFLESGEIEPGDIRLYTRQIPDPYIDEATNFIEPSTALSAEQQPAVYCSQSVISENSSNDTKPNPGLNLNWSNLSITKDSTTSTKTKISEKVAAEFGVSLDRGAKQKITNADDTVTLKNKDLTSANFNIALVDFLQYKRAEDSSRLTPGPSLTPFVALNYQSDLDPKNETDDFSVGLIWKQFFSDRNFRADDGLGFRFELDHFLLQGSYITDIEQRESQQWAGQLTLPFASYDGSFYRSDEPFFSYYVTANIVSDHMKIARAGDKKALITLTEEQDTDKLTRIGYDIGFASEYKLDEAWSIDFNAKYQYRDAFQNGGLGDTDRWELGLDFKPNLESPLAFGVTYERGENLSSLAEEEIWKFGVKFKQ